MKVRAGFVSNSSSSSFCIVGVVIDIDKFTGCDDYQKLIDSMEWNENLIIQHGIYDYYEKILVGKRICSMKDDQTLGGFKRDIFNELQKNGFNGSIEDIAIHIDGGYEG